MRGYDFLEKMELIDPTYIEAADVAPSAKKANRLKKWIAFAACFILLFSVGFGTYAYTVEEMEYNAAVQFFNDYDLSTEGLTRGEIKKVYRDITTHSFSYSKTAEVIQNSLSSDQVEGYEIFQESPTPEDLENLWNYKNYKGGFVFPEKTGVYYKDRTEYGYYKDGRIDHGNFQSSYLEKYDGDTLIWSVAIPEFQVFGHTPVSDGVIAYGETPTFAEGPQYAWLAKIDDSGAVLWTHKMDNGFEHEYIAAILENTDGSYGVISRGDFDYFCLSQYTASGEVTHFKKTEVGNYGILNAARLGDGYIVQLGSYATNEYAKIVKVDYEGNIMESFSYGAEDELYYITDMTEFDGRIYLSAYALSDVKIPFLDSAENLAEFNGADCTEFMQKGYTALLLVCDPSSGTPQKFYSVKGSLGAKLSLSDDGNLLWDVERITTVFYSPYTSSFTFGGTCRVFRYKFDTAGTLIRQEKTDEITNFRR